MNNPKPLICALCLLGMVLINVSCEEENDLTGPGQLLVTMKANQVSFCYVDYKVVVTDSQGSVLAATNFNGASDMPILGSAPEGTQSVNLFLVRMGKDYYGKDYYHVTGYLALKRGTDFSGLSGYNATGSPREVNLTSSTFPSFDNLILSTDIASYSLTKNSYEQLPQRLFLSANSLFAQVISGGEGRYGFVQIDGSTNTVNLDYALMNTLSTKQRFVPEGIASGYFISISGSFSEQGPMADKFFIYRNPNHYETDLYYPPVFARYSTEIAYSMNNRYYTEIKTGTQPDFDFKPIAFNTRVSNYDPKNFSMEVTGDFDYYRADFSNNTDVTLTVYARRCDASFSLPDFSQVKGLRAYPSGRPNYFSLELFDHQILREDQPYFKYFSSAFIDVESTYNMQTVKLTEPM